MSTKSLLYLGAAIGGTIGGFIPALWGAGTFSAWGVLFEGIGGLLGIWLMWKFTNA
jgi:hypothetical protein